ncbi:hypothetical protein CRG98_027825 [Punica granatum]|uniref:Uncharacterized protein n=1 Tax=Punica granatum TaxID=22663 RepID=A0A2I0J6C8_PUNGR|nr:hypothetical protein CRG98_027825 [Punica granatum]
MPNLRRLKSGYTSPLWTTSRRSDRFLGSFEVYFIPLDPGNLPALDIQVAKWYVATFSHVRPSRVLGKVNTPKPRCISSRIACLNEIKIQARNARAYTTRLGKVNTPKPRCISSRIACLNEIKIQEFKSRDRLEGRTPDNNLKVKMDPVQKFKIERDPKQRFEVGIDPGDGPLTRM